MYTVERYLYLKKKAKRSPRTIQHYRHIFTSFAKVIGVPVENLHEHLTPENLMKYAENQEGKSGRSTRVNLTVLKAYYQHNQIPLEKLEMDVLTARPREEHYDKTLTLDLLQKLMDVADIRGKAVISFLISTGMRPGEAARILVSDVNGDTVTIRNEIAKGGRGGKAYLTTEAQGFLDLFLKERERHIKSANARAKSLKQTRPDDDQRLFGASYKNLANIFSHLYSKIDGEKGPYHNRVTPHSCRRYFRTNAVKTIPLDIVEHILRHSGYLTDSYVRFTDDAVREAFHAGEAALYITRADHRIQGSKITELENEIRLLKQAKEDERGIRSAVPELSPADVQRIAVALAKIQK